MQSSRKLMADVHYNRQTDKKADNQLENIILRQTLVTEDIKESCYYKGAQVAQ